MKQYNKKLNFNDYIEGNMKVKYYKTGENRKLAPRRGGPWIVLRKLPNDVNFEIKNIATKEVKIVPCDRLTPVKENNTKSQRLQHNNHPEDAAEHDSSSKTDSDQGRCITQRL